MQCNMFQYFKRRKTMVLTNIFCFYLGCFVTLFFIKTGCLSSDLNLPNLPNDYKSVEYAILILSNPDNEAKRHAIRDTWLNFASSVFADKSEKLLKQYDTSKNHKSKLIQVYFAVGTQGLDHDKLLKLKAEHSVAKDLLLLDDIEDNYKNLALKMKNSLKWLSRNHYKLKYVIKCDDDSFVRVDKIIMNLEEYAPNMNAPELAKYISIKDEKSSFNGLYWGYFDGRAKVYLSGKWEERDWFLCDNYLPYALGGGYVISRNILDYIAYNSDMLSHYTSEDVSMGVWTAALSGINRVHDIRFDTEWKSRGCTNDLLVRHKQTPNDMFEMYRTFALSDGKKICKSETLSRKSYLYKWNVLPSMCCR